jgi:hypothetical protein
VKVRQLLDDLAGMDEDAEVVIMVTEEGVHDGPTRTVHLDHFWGNSPLEPKTVTFTGKMSFW